MTQSKARNTNPNETSRVTAPKVTSTLRSV